MRTLRADSFEIWREQARALLSHHVTPLEVSWADHDQPMLFGETPLSARKDFEFRVPTAFMAFAETISCHADVRRWDLLYQLLFRIHSGEKHLLSISTDPLVRALEIMEKAIRRDAHKAKAFVRFRLVQENEREHYIAWHRPDHRILPLVAPFFSRRFSSMEWTILTPEASVHWDGTHLNWGPGVPASEAPSEDALENLWRDYYRATFNPARIKLKMMKREMPVRHWHSLPETHIIHSLLAEAPQRVETMIKHQQQRTASAAAFLPDTMDLSLLRNAAKSCEGCELHKHAHQAVFGEGPSHARIMLVGEQPGNDEDVAGRPFVGPAGKILDEVLDSVGLSRSDLYITNAVKHFRFLYRDSFRQHQSPSRYHVAACKPWLTAEIASVQPKLIVCLGNTAARALIHPNFVMKDGRGKAIGHAPTLFATYHPSAILRAPKSAAEAMRHGFTDDLRLAVQLLDKIAA